MPSLIQPKRVTAASEYRFGGAHRGERAVGANGEINAYSRGEALSRGLEFQAAHARGEVDLDGAVLSRETAAAKVRARRELARAAMSNPTAFRQVGETMAKEIYMTTNRKGFARRFLNPIELKQGDIPRFPVRQKNVNAFYITAASRIETQVVTDKWLTPPEAIITTRPFISQIELNQSNTDVLEEKAVEALEGIMVTEDRFWYNMAKQTVGVDNNQSIISGTLSPQSLMAVRQEVQKWGLKAAFCLMANDLFQDIVGDASFIQAIEPVARHELLLTGELAVMYGMTIISEAYRHPEHQVLSEGEFLVVSEPATHGAYSDRGGVDSAPTDGVSENRPGKGWLLTESWAAAIANSRSVSVGIRA